MDHKLLAVKEKLMDTGTGHAFARNPVFDELNKLNVRDVVVLNGHAFIISSKSPNAIYGTKTTITKIETEG